MKDIGKPDTTPRDAPAEGAPAPREDSLGQEDLLRVLADQTPDLVFAKDLAGRYVFVNRALLEACGESAEALLGKTDAACRRSNAVASVLAANDREVMESGEARVFEEVVEHTGGRRVYLSTKAPLRDREGRLRGVFGVARDVTRYRDAEEMIRKREKTLAQAAEMAHFGAWEVEVRSSTDLCQNAFSWSDEVFRIFGYEPGSLRADNDFFFSHVHPDDRSRVHEALARALETRGRYALEHRVVRPDGAVRVVQENAELFFDEQGALRRVVGAIQDITERARAEEALRESEQRLRDAEEVARVAADLTGFETFDYWPRTGRLYWSERAKRLHGMPAGAEVDYAAFLRGIHPDDRKRVERSIAAALRPSSDGDYAVEYRVVSSGHERWMEARGKVLFDESGEAVRLVGGGVDVTARKRASEAYVTKILENVGEAFVAFDPDGRFAYASRAAEDLLGKERGAMLGRRAEELFPDGPFCAGEQPPDDTSRARPRDVEWRGRWYRVTRDPLPDGGVAFHLRDTTEEREIARRRDALLEAERGAREAAEEVNRVHDEFLATTSHELRTPLAAILGWVGVLRQRPDDPASAARAGEVIERNARAQARILDDIFDMSRILSGKMALEVHDLDLARVVVAAADVVRPAAQAKRIEIRLDLQAGAGLVAGDADRLQQIAWNLLSNAVKFTPEQGLVEVTLRRDGARVLLCVRDTGQGIAPEFLPHVFERFRQQDGSSTRRYGGLGLGLSIVRELVELHGGTVHAESFGVGRGAAFTVALRAPGSA